ncbi:hypothetical protein BaRGS_00035001 [Batillaria attramentaria]|uniref:Uncharacterized protein n=1 Tax=Batillaria attramentaria TaxID=370345 RepID=A0ABD0JG09_9CAEN
MNSLQDWRAAIGVFCSRSATKWRSDHRVLGEYTVDDRCSGLDIACAFVWLVFSTQLLYSIPFCVFMVYNCQCHPLCAELSSARPCSATTVVTFDPAMSHSCTDTPIVTQVYMLLVPPDARDLIGLLLLCGDVETNPGPVDQELKDAIQRLEEKYDRQAERMNQMLSDITTTLQTQGQQLEQKLEENYETLKTHVVHLQDTITSTQETAKQNMENIRRVADNQDRLADGLAGLEDDIDKLERYSRRNNVLLYGVAEEARETYDSCCEKVITTLQKYMPGKEWKPEDVERCHRLGGFASQSQRPRPIIVKFQRWGDAMLVMRNREAKEVMRGDDLRVAADLTRRQRQQLQELYAQGKRGYFVSGRLVVKDRLNDPKSHDDQVVEEDLRMGNYDDDDESVNTTNNAAANNGASDTNTDTNTGNTRNEHTSSQHETDQTTTEKSTTRVTKLLPSSSYAAVTASSSGSPRQQNQSDKSSKEGFLTHDRTIANKGQVNADRHSTPSDTNTQSPVEARGDTPGVNTRAGLAARARNKMTQRVHSSQGETTKEACADNIQDSATTRTRKESPRPRLRSSPHPQKKQQHGQQQSNTLPNSWRKDSNR